MAGILADAGFPYSEELAAEWIAPFLDELDPTFIVLQWLEAGWRDARLVAAAQRICGTADRATNCMELLAIETSSPLQDWIVDGLREAVSLLPPSEE